MKKIIFGLSFIPHMVLSYFFYKYVVELESVKILVLPGIISILCFIFQMIYVAKKVTDILYDDYEVGEEEKVNIENKKTKIIEEIEVIEEKEIIKEKEYKQTNILFLNILIILTFLLFYIPQIIQFNYIKLGYLNFIAHNYTVIQMSLIVICNILIIIISFYASFKLVFTNLKIKQDQVQTIIKVITTIIIIVSISSAVFNYKDTKNASSYIEEQMEYTLWGYNNNSSEYTNAQKLEVKNSLITMQENIDKIKSSSMIKFYVINICMLIGELSSIIVIKKLLISTVNIKEESDE